MTPTRAQKSEPDDSGGGNRMLTILLVIAAAIATLYIALGREKAAPADVALSARRWADRAGIRITGVDCRGSRCTFDTPGQPFDATCEPEGCALICGSEPR